MSETVTTGSEDFLHQDLLTESSRRPKRQLIESACAACRRRKSKCDGRRPTCTRCRQCNTECHFEAEEGESRYQALRRKNEQESQKSADYRDMFDLLQEYVTEPGLQDLIDNIRSNNNISTSQVLMMMRQRVLQARPAARSEMSPGVASTGFARAGTVQLPPLRTVVDLPIRTTEQPIQYTTYPIRMVNNRSTSTVSHARSQSGGSRPSGFDRLRPPQ